MFLQYRGAIIRDFLMMSPFLHVSSIPGCHYEGIPDNGNPVLQKHVGTKVCLNCVYFYCTKSWLDKLNLTSFTARIILRIHWSRNFNHQSQFRLKNYFKTMTFRQMSPLSDRYEAAPPLKPEILNLPVVFLLSISEVADSILRQDSYFLSLYYSVFFLSDL